MVNLDTHTPGRFAPRPGRKEGTPAMPLTLTRHLGESVVLQTPEGEVIVTIVAIDGRRVRLGFTAPKEVEIFRQELLGPPGQTKPK